MRTKIDFSYLTEMEMAIKCIERINEMYPKAPAVSIIEKHIGRYENVEEHYGSIIVEFENPNWLYHIGHSVGMRYETPF